MNERETKRNIDVQLSDANVEPTPYDASLGKKKAQRFYPQARCKVIVYSYRKRDSDCDGISAKALIDGLVHVGIFEDDSSKFIESYESKVIKIKSTEEEKTVLEIIYEEE